MSSKASAIVQKVWNYAHVLKDDGLAFMDYTEQITYLLFLKLAWEQRSKQGGCEIPLRYSWGKLIAIKDNAKLANTYQRSLKKLSEQSGLLALIFTKPQSKINDPAKLRRLVDMINAQEWSTLDYDVKGEIYEGLLARNAEDVRGGAGQYFTPRPIIRAIVQVMRPEPTMRIADPACGTGGFLLAAHELSAANPKWRESGGLKILLLPGFFLPTFITKTLLPSSGWIFFRFFFSFNS
jgi:type I restriction enzyme M protein